MVKVLELSVMSVTVIVPTPVNAMSLSKLASKLVVGATPVASSAGVRLVISWPFNWWPQLQHARHIRPV